MQTIIVSWLPIGDQTSVQVTFTNLNGISLHVGAAVIPAAAKVLTDAVLGHTL